MKLQIALDYMMVFIFILVIFMIMFLSIAKQRATFANEQSFAQLQIIAQTIASDISIAGQAGNGYTASFLLPSELSYLKYNVSITKFGTVIVSTNPFGHVVQAIAFSGQYDLLSNSSYLAPPSNTYYAIPTYNGTGYLTVQNSQGTICIDYSCPSTSNQISQMTLSSQTTGAVQFYGLNPGITVSNMNFNVIGNSYTLCAWVNIPSYQPSSYGEVLAAPQYANSGLVASDIAPSGYQIGSYLGGNSNPLGHAAYGTWNFFCAVYTGVGSTLRTDYINANAVGTDTSGGLVNIINAPMYIGNSGYTCCGDTTNPPDYESNVQMYGNALSANQISTLYQEGIAGNPLVAANVIGWWPLNGNANDYSGNGNNGAVSGAPVNYPSVSQLSVAAINSTSNSVVGGLIGFFSSIGSFTAGPSTSNRTNPAGTATAFATQSAYSGTGIAIATAFNGNYSASNSLVGWWPLNEQYGNKVYDISPQSSNTATYSPANIFYASWASPRYVTQVSNPSSINLNPIYQEGATNSLSYSVWFKVLSTPGSWPMIFGDTGGSPRNGYDLYVGGSGSTNPGSLTAERFAGGSGVATSSTPISQNNWYLAVLTYDGTDMRLYLNGVLQGTIASSGSITVNSIMSLGSDSGYTNYGNYDLADLQAYSTALTSAQAVALYSEGFAGPPISNTNLIGWWPLNGDTLDYSMKGNNATSLGNAQPVQYSFKTSNPIHLLTTKFNGASSYASTSLAPSTVGTPITIAGWVDPQNNPLNYQGYFGWRYTDSAAGSGDFYILQLAGTNLLEMRFQNSAGTAYSYESGQNVQVVPNTWNFVALTYNGSYIKAYVNGVPFAPIAATGSFGSGTASPFTIGAQDELGSIVNFFQGSESNIQVYNSALSTSQMSRLYQEGISGFPIANAKIAGWWPLNGDTNDYSSSMNNAVPTNVVYNSIRANSPGQMPSLSGYGLYMNGVSSNVVVSNFVPSGAVSSETQAAWIYLSSLPPSGSYSQITWQESYLGGLYVSSTGNVVFGAFPGGVFSSIPSNMLVHPNTWYFVSGSYSSSSGLGVCVDAVCVNTTKTGAISSSGAFDIGAKDGTSLFFNGTIADVMVYNSVLSDAQLGLLYSSGMPLTRSAPMSFGVT